MARLRSSPTGEVAQNPGVSARYCLLILLSLPIIGMVAATTLGLDQQFGLDMLRQHHSQLLGFVATEPALAALMFIGIYFGAAASSVPGIGVLTVFGGFLFGWWWGAIYSMLAATTAGAAVFLVARSALGAPMRARAGPWLQRFSDGFRRSALTYVFVLNLIPIFPYAVVIAIPAACGVRLRTYLCGAFAGILPGTLLLAHFGAGLDAVLAQGHPLQLVSFMTPQIVWALVGLAALALLPVVYRAFKPWLRSAP